MAILTAAANRQSRGAPGAFFSYPVAVDIIYKGALVSINAAGFLAPAGDTASEFCVGVADQTVDNSGGSAGDLSCRVVSGRAFLMTATSLIQGDVGENATVVDDNEVEVILATTNDVVVGRIIEFVSATSVWVFIPMGGQPI